MLRKVLFFTFFVSSITFAQVDNNQCKFYPVKEEKPLYYGQFLLDRIEYDNKNNLNYEITGWYGGDYKRLWIEAEGEHNLRKDKGNIE